MSWFLINRKKKTRPASRPAKPLPSQVAWDPRRTLRGFKALGLVAMLVGVAVGWRYAERSLKHYTATTSRAARVAPAGVILAHEPPGMSLLLGELKETVARQIGADPLRNDGLRRAAEVLARNPWVERVHEVRRRGDGKILVSARIRQPVAVVKGVDGYHMVDAKGVRLPGLYLEHQLESLDRLVIVGVALQPGEAGEVWPGEDLQAGLALIPWLVDAPYVKQIRAVDVSQRDTRGRVRLILHTDRGMVRWGLAPGVDQAVELDVVGKLRRLEQLHTQKGSIDAGGKIVDIYGPAIFVHQPSLRQTTFRDSDAQHTWGR